MGNPRTALRKRIHTVHDALLHPHARYMPTPAATNFPADSTDFAEHRQEFGHGFDENVTSTRTYPIRVTAVHLEP